MIITRHDLRQLKGALTFNRTELQADSVVLDRFIHWSIGQRTDRAGTFELPDEFQPFYERLRNLPEYEPDPEPLPHNSPQNKAHDMSHNFLTKFDRLTKPTKTMFERLESLRRGPSESELQRAVRLALKAAERERRQAAADPVTAVLADPEQQFYWDAMCRILGGARVRGEQAELLRELRALKGLDPSAPLGDALLPVPVSTDVYDLLLTYGAFRFLGVRTMPSTKTKFAKVSSLPATWFITPTATGNARSIPTDLALNGSNISQQANIVATLINVSQEVLEDEKVDLADLLLRLFVQAIAGRIDFACFQGDGTDDVNSGAQTGLFRDTTVAAVTSAPSHTSILSLIRDDFLAVMGAVAPAALQRPCRWFINPAFIPSLMALKDEAAQAYLLRTPAETGGEWHLVGFPVTWAAQAPGDTTVGRKIAAFGEPNSLLVGVREDFELGTSNGALFAQNIRQIRALARARSDMRQSTGWAVLKLAES